MSKLPGRAYSGEQYTNKTSGTAREVLDNSIIYLTNTINNVLGIALILHSRIKPKNEAKMSIRVVLDTLYMSGTVYASTMPPVVGTSYLTE
jgi:hypothetical protein